MIDTMLDMEILSNTIYRHAKHVSSNRKVGSRSFRYVLFPQSQISDLFIFALSTVWQYSDRNATAIAVPRYLALWIKQNPSKLSNLMVLDDKIITTYRDRKAVSYLQRDEAILKRLFILKVHKTELLSLMVESLYFECTQDNKTWP